MKPIKIEIEVTGCKDCPHLTTGRTYGNDGRDGVVVYMCQKGGFGSVDYWGAHGMKSIPKVPPIKCPYFNANPSEIIASELGVSTIRLLEVIEQNGCKLEKIKGE